MFTFNRKSTNPEVADLASKQNQFCGRLDLNPVSDVEATILLNFGSEGAVMFLEIRKGRAKHLKRTVIEPVFVVGANRQCDMVLGDNQFGPIHFYILKRDGRTTIRKIGYQPEISVNGSTVDNSVDVEDGDRIRTGPFEFVVKAA